MSDWFDFGKWVLGTGFASIAGVLISYDIQTTELEIKKKQAESEIMIAEAKATSEITIKRLEQERVFLDSFLEHAMNADILPRIRLAHYMKSATNDENIAAQWGDFYDELVDICKKEWELSEQEVSGATRRVRLQADCDVGGVEEIASAPANFDTVEGLLSQLAINAKVDGFEVDSSRAKELQCFESVPESEIEIILNAIENAKDFNIVGAAIFLGNICFERHSLAEFRQHIESASAGTIYAMFMNHFESIEVAKEFEGNVEKLMNFVYANDRGNRGEDSGDGFKYQMRGYVGVFGRSNYEALGNSMKINFIDFPDLVDEPEYAIVIAINYFRGRTQSGISALEWANAGKSSVVRRLVNGSEYGTREVDAIILSIIALGLFKEKQSDN